MCHLIREHGLIDMSDSRLDLLIKTERIVSDFLQKGGSDPDVLEQFPCFDPKREPLIGKIYQRLNQYIVDEDIRKKDPDYGEYQMGVILELNGDLLAAIAMQKAQ